MHFTTLVLAAVSTTGLVSALPPSTPLHFEERADVPSPNDVKLIDVQYGGSGCPQGSVGKSISEDKSVITLIFDKYIAEAGPNMSPAKSRAVCQINVKMAIPQGFQFGVFKADYRGYVNIPEKAVTGVATAQYYFSGLNKNLDREVQFPGPVTADYFKEDKIDVATTIWSPCGTEAMLNIKSAVSLRGTATKPASMTVSLPFLSLTQ